MDKGEGVGALTPRHGHVAMEHACRTSREPWLLALTAPRTRHYDNTVPRSEAGANQAEGRWPWTTLNSQRELIQRAKRVAPLPDRRGGAVMPDEVTAEVEAEFVLGADPADVVGVSEDEVNFHPGQHPDNGETDLGGVDAEPPPPPTDEDDEAPLSDEELAALGAEEDTDAVDNDGFDDDDVVVG
jgi:hypothetical protein